MPAPTSSRSSRRRAIRSANTAEACCSSSCNIQAQHRLDLDADDDGAHFVRCTKRRSGDRELRTRRDRIARSRLRRTHAGHSRATMLSISNFGRGGPWTNRPATEFTCWRKPVRPRRVGFRKADHQRGRPHRRSGWRRQRCGCCAAALRRARSSGRGDHVDLSLLEAVTPNVHVQSLYGR